MSPPPAAPPAAPPWRSLLAAPGWGWSLALMAIVVLGGGNWTMPLPRLPASLLAIGMLAAAIGSRGSRFPVKLVSEDRHVLALLALFALHLVPLPPSLWTALPGRETASAIDTAVFGAPRWRPLSLDPAASLRALATLIPALAVYVAVRGGDALRRAALLRGIVLAMILAMTAAAAQLLWRDAAWLHFYPRGDYAFPVGFFTNHNHQAIFLIVCLPWLALWLGEAGTQARRGLVLAGAAALVAVFALATASRSGAVLLIAGLLLTGAAWLRAAPGDAPAPPRRLRHPLLLAGGVLVALMLLLIGLGGDALTSALRRSAMADDLRLDFWPHVANAAAAFWPYGSGLGTFFDAYAMVQPLADVSPLALNHAHDEPLEIALEAGVPGLILLISVVWRFAEAARDSWRRGPTTPALAAARFASVVAALLLAHSLVDYPLRGFALSCLFAMAWAMLAGAAESRNGQVETAIRLNS